MPNHNPGLSALHKRLNGYSKKPVVALMAVMRKPFVLCNAVPRLQPA